MTLSVSADQVIPWPVMSLVFDERNKLQGQPGLHALIIGVSAYPNLPKANGILQPQHYGMRQLSSTALAAYRIYQWLASQTTKLSVPLATCRMLLMPSQAELSAEAALQSFTTSWTTLDVLKAAADWREDASTNRDNVTFFYFAGHGVQRYIGDSVMLLPGFGDGVGGTLKDAVDTANITTGMAPTPTRPQIAQTQFYFVDACRILPDEFLKFQTMSTTPVFNLELNLRDDRCAPIFYAAIPGTIANGIRGQQTLFNRALLECLNSTAAEATDEEDAQGNVKWRVSVHSLDKALTASIKDLNGTLKANQEYTPGGSPKDTAICYLDAAPLVDVTLQVDPAQAIAFGKLEVRDYQDQPIWEESPPIHPHPCKKQLPAGNYKVNVIFDPPRQPYKNYTRLRYVKPLPRKLELTVRCQ